MLKHIILALWGVVGLYGAAAGWARAELEEQIVVASRGSGPTEGIVCGGITFQDLASCLEYQREKETSVLFPWVYRIPPFFALMIMALATGSLGGVARTLRERARSPSTYPAYAYPPLGALMGLVALGASYLVPSALTVDETTLRPTSLLFLCLFAGLFWDTVFAWAEGLAKQLFHTS